MLYHSANDVLIGWCFIIWLASGVLMMVSFFVYEMFVIGRKIVVGKNERKRRKK